MLWDVRKIKLWGKRRRERNIFFHAKKRRKVHRKSKADEKYEFICFVGICLQHKILNILLMISWMSGSIYLRWFFSLDILNEIHTRKVILKYFNIGSQMKLFWFEHETFLIIFIIWLATRGIVFQSPSKINSQQQQQCYESHQWAEKFRVQKLKNKASWVNSLWLWISIIISRHAYQLYLFSVELPFYHKKKKRIFIISLNSSENRKMRYNEISLQKERRLTLCVTIVDQKDSSCNWRHSQSQNHSQLLTATSS